MRRIEPGIRIGHYFEIVGELGHGGMGTVYRAVQHPIGRLVAVKVIRLDDSRDETEVEDLRARLLREAQAAGILTHPGIVTVHHAGEHEGLPYIVMELVEGESVEAVLRRGPVRPADAARVIRQAAEALDYAHSMGVIHRDVKPANILLDPNGKVKLCDFGIAKQMTGVQNLTRAGLLAGSDNYMSPEQWRAETLDGRADQYSLAVTAFQILCGRHPFPARSLPELMGAVCYGDRPRASDLRRELGGEVDAVLARGMAKSRDERYASCTDFARVLEKVCERVADELPPELPSAGVCRSCGASLPPGSDLCSFCASHLPSGLDQAAGQPDAGIPPPVPLIVPQRAVEPVSPWFPATREPVPPPAGVGFSSQPTVPLLRPPARPPAVVPAPRPASSLRSRWPVPALVVAAVLVAGGSFAIWQLQQRKPDATPPQGSPVPGGSAETVRVPAPPRPTARPGPTTAGKQPASAPAEVRPESGAAPPAATVPIPPETPAPSPPPTTTAAPQWATFHGDRQRTGFSQALGPRSPAIAWVAELGGQVRTSPVVGADATVYVGSTDRKVYAVLAGRVVWQAPVGSFEDHSLELMPDGSVRLAIPSQGRPQAFELARISAAGEILPNRVPRLTSRFSAESAEGRTFFAEGSELRQLGDGSWKVDAGAPISTFPVIDRRGRVCAGTSAGTLICADRYGRVLWSYRAQAPITASPAAGPDGDILFGCADRRLYCVRDGALRWQFPTGGAIYSAPVVDASGTAYFGSNDGSLYAVNESGDRIWSLPLGNEIHGSPAFDSSGSLYVGTLARKLFCISDSSRISRKSGLQIQ